MVLMPRSIPASPNVEMLAWARASVGLDPVGAARRVGVQVDVLLAWEAGSAKPTVAQLRKVSEAYKRPLAVFYLPEPPKSFDTLRDFRRVAGSDEGVWSVALHGEFERAHFQREALLELYELDDVEPKTGWAVALAGTDEEVAAGVRRLLIGGSAGPPGGTDPYAIFNYWSSRLEDLGVMVHSTSGGQVAVKEMRAFSLYFDVLPVIVLNGADAVKGRVFSLLHEFSHLILRTGGLCDTTASTDARSADRRLEAKCNRIAAGVLMPERAVRRQVARLADAGPLDWALSALRDAGAEFGVSAEAYCRRLATLGFVSGTFYMDRRTELQDAYDSEELVARSTPGGNWYRNKSRDLGKGYVREVASAWQRRVIDSATAVEFLDAKVGQIPKLAEAAGLTGVDR